MNPLRRAPRPPRPTAGARRLHRRRPPRRRGRARLGLGRCRGRARRRRVGRSAHRRARACPRPTVGGHRGRLSRSCARGRARARVRRALASLRRASPPTRSCTRSAPRCSRAARVVILTNAAGGLDPDVPVGTPVLLRDHLNLTGASPHDRATTRPSRFGAASATSPRRTTPSCGRSRASVDPDLPEGVYAGLLGGAYETPAEIRMLRDARRRPRRHVDRARDDRGPPPRRACPRRQPGHELGGRHHAGAARPRRRARPRPRAAPRLRMTAGCCARHR